MSIKPVEKVLVLHIRHERGLKKFVNVSEWRVTDQGNLIIEMAEQKGWQFVYAKGAWSELESVWE